MSADIYIDDRNIGGLPDWGTIYQLVNGAREKRQKKHNKRFWQKLFGR